jgi:hypothetical protein
MMKNYNKAPLIMNAVLLLLVVVVAATNSGLLLLTADAFSYSSSYTTAGTSALCRRSHSGADNNNNNNNKSLVLFLSSSTADDDDGDNINNNKRKIPTNSILETRRGTFQRIVSEGATATAAVFVTAAAAASTATAKRANAADTVVDTVVVTDTATAATTATTTNDNVNKQYNLSDEEIMKIISNDIIENQFLVNGQLTRNIYDEKCTFQDEIDTYELNKWISGTSKLFDSTRSKVLMVNNSLKPMSNNEGIEFRFVEYLCFNIPFVKPIVYLSGTLELKRSITTGLITSYQEKWDQNIYNVLSKKSKLFSSSITNDELDQELQLFYNVNANNAN